MADNARGVPQVQGLDLFYAMYVIGLAFGIEEISGALFKRLRDFPEPSINIVLLDGLFFFALLLLTLRFFWSTGNIRRAWARSIGSARSVVALHLPVLLGQGALVTFSCIAFADSITDSPESYGPVMGWYITATAWNACWLRSLMGEERPMPEWLWLKNNVSMVLIGGLLFALQLKFPSYGLVTAALFALIAIGSSFFDLLRTANAYMSDFGR